MTEPTRLELAVAELCSARVNVENERNRARAELGRIFDAPDLFAAHTYLAALTAALDRLDLVLALVTDELPACHVDELEAARELLEVDPAAVEELVDQADPASSSWRRVLAEWQGVQA